MYGVEIYYLPRKFITTNTVIREVIESKFDSAFPLEAYVDSYEGYGGQGTILSKFGIQEVDDLTLIISKERYENYITPLSRSLLNIELSTRPKEGDLIYFPLGDKLFEIKYVEHEQPFYQLQKNYVYTLRCELFRYEDEVLDTGVEEIDNEIEQIGYIQTLTLVGSAVTATATATICANGGVNKIYISNMGNNYNTEPTIGFSSAPSGGITAIGIASITNDYVNCTGNTGGKVQAVYISNSGCGYTVAPWIKFNVIGDNTGTGAAATTGIGTGTIQTVSIGNSGSGYISNPTVTFSGPVGGGITATGIGYINSAGNVTAIYMTHAGVGYTSAPTITISSPTGIGATIGIGTYVFNEIVIGSSSGTTARVKKYTRSSSTLEVSIVDGTFTPGERIYGQTSGAIYSLKNQNTDDLITPYADNDTIELEADSIIDFSEINPFGMP